MSSIWFVLGAMAWTFLSVWVGHHITLMAVREERDDWYHKERAKLAKEVQIVIEAAIGDEFKPPPSTGHTFVEGDGVDQEGLPRP